MKKAIREILVRRRKFHEEDGRMYGVYGKSLLETGGVSGDELFDAIQFVEDTDFTLIQDYELITEMTGTVTVTDAGGGNFTVARQTGDEFDAEFLNRQIKISGTLYPVTVVTDADTLTITGYTGAVAPNVVDYWMDIVGMDLNVYDGITFPAGITIFGLFHNLEVNTGVCIAYKSKEN